MSNEIAVQQPQQLVKASTQLSHRLGIDTPMLIETLKSQCFKGKHPDEVTDAQLASLISVCNAIGLNPLIPGMVYCYPEKNGGISPIVGPDGTMKKIDEFIEAGKLDGYEVELFPEDPALKPTHAKAIIYRKDKMPAKYTAFFNEWCVNSNANWQSRPRHMLWIRALKQCARQVIHGLPMDDDEYKLSQMLNVTPGESADQANDAPPKTKRTPPPQRSQKGVAAVVENAPEQPKPVEQAAVEIQATPTPEAPAPAKPVAEVAVDTPAEPAVEAAPEPKAPVTQLAHQESGTFVSKIVSFTHTAKGNTNAKLEGEFTGEVFQMDSKKNPAYVEGAVCRFKLEGQYSAKNNLTYNMVRGIEAQMPEEF